MLVRGLRQERKQVGYDTPLGRNRQCESEAECRIGQDNTGFCARTRCILALKRQHAVYRCVVHCDLIIWKKNAQIVELSRKLLTGGRFYENEAPENPPQMQAMYIIKCRDFVAFQIYNLLDVEKSGCWLNLSITVGISLIGVQVARCIFPESAGAQVVNHL